MIRHSGIEAHLIDEAPFRRRYPLAVVPSLIALVLAGAALFPASSAAQANEGSLDPAEFKNPPPAARPRVWWHWLNGNISKDGIRKDLEWMKRSGIGGVQTFDINFQTPTVVDERLIYMTPAWKDAFRFAAQEADRLGLELTIASSPGWSLTGGPWVKPEDGIKKLVWSETVVQGGDRKSLVLPPPPAVSGPFQDIPLTPEPGADPKHVTPRSYGDIAVVAYRASVPPNLPVPSFMASDGSVLDGQVLTDGKFTAGVPVKRDSANGAAIDISYPAPQTVRALSTFLPGSADLFNGPSLQATFEASQDGKTWNTVAEFSPTLVPSTIGFAPVTARLFRLRLKSIDTLSPIDTASAPGYAGVNYALLMRSGAIRLAELNLLGEQKVDQFEAKGGFAVVRDYFALDAKQNAGEVGVARDDMIDLTSRLQADGTLDWKAPPGIWRVLRLGWSLTGKTNHPAPAEATGLEVDKLDGDAVTRYMEQYLRNYRETVGADLIGDRGIGAVLTDSTEVGSFNWTPKLPQAFRRLRGYDMRPWLPALTGVLVASRGETDRFLYDFRRTIADLHASEHYGTVARVAHANGLKVYGEALEGWRVSLGDDIDMRRYTDVPMAAMWTFPRETGPRPLLVADLRTAASNAHLRGMPLVAAESMTSSRFPWAHGPADLRRIVDTEFANGINRIVIHTSPHQPVDDKQPGLSLRHIGQFFTRHETWAEMARPWIDYISRSSHLLQQGRFVADVAYFVGEEAPPGTLAETGRLADVPRGYGFDFVNASSIVNDMEVRDGALVTAGSASYRALFLSGNSSRMTVPVLRRIARLVEQGATVVGQAPIASPSLADDPAEFKQLIGKLWSGQSVTDLGKGRVIASGNAETALASVGVEPDFIARPISLTSGSYAPPIDFVHRRSPTGDVYFVRNSGNQRADIAAEFRVDGKVPEIWDAVTGEVRPVSYEIAGGQTTVPLSIPAEESRFIVFRGTAVSARIIVPEPVLREQSQVSGRWSVTFQAGRGAPAAITLPALAPLSEHVNPGVRYFSGVASYRTTLTAPRVAPGQRLILELGAVADLAEVRVNGRLVGTTWSAPHRLDVGSFVRPGRNALEVRVANLWANRLIGDAQPGATKIAWTSAPMYKADAPLRPSGLIGPVRLLTDR